MKTTLHAMSGLVLVAAGLVVGARAADLDFGDPVNVPGAARWLARISVARSEPGRAAGVSESAAGLRRGAVLVVDRRSARQGAAAVADRAAAREGHHRRAGQLRPRGLAGLADLCRPNRRSSPSAWWDVWKFVADECRKRGMGIGLSSYTLDWPNGKSLISRTIYSSPKSRDARSRSDASSVWRPARPLACELPADTVAVRAYPVGGGRHRRRQRGPDGVESRDQRLDWTPAQGDWEVWVFTAARKPGTLNSIHPLAGRRVVRELLPAVPGPRPGQSAAGLNYFFNDELHFGVGDRIWTDDFAAEFQRRKGYDLFEVLPAHVPGRRSQDAPRTGWTSWTSRCSWRRSATSSRSTSGTGPRA